MNHKEKELAQLGFKEFSRFHWNDARSALCEKALAQGEGHLSHHGALVTITTPHTGRLPNAKAFAKEASSREIIDWGKINKPIDEAFFEEAKKDLIKHLEQGEVYVQEHYAGADAKHQIPVRVVSEKASAALFARTMLIREKDPNKIENFTPDYTLLHAPEFHADPKKHGTNSDAFILIHFGQKVILIGGTLYAGEIKKSIFTLMNYHLPQDDVMSMHCSANYGETKDDVAIFFGLSGTGKTTLSASSDRTLIGDDEHGWNDEGVFNIEGGCYAKVIRLSSEKEPEIYKTTHRYGTILENVAMDEETREIDLNDASLAENTRAMYPISFIPNMDRSGRGGQPKNIIMLTCDAFGVLPPVAKLTPDQARYHFLSGYTAKVAGTEEGVKEPQATFSPCFGAPFMPLAPKVYADLLARKIKKYEVPVWLVNTGWSGGAYGSGERMDLVTTRAIIQAILKGSLMNVETRYDERFGFEIPMSCPDVENNVLDPKKTWKDQSAYEAQATKLANMFVEHFKENFSEADPELVAAGPRID